jgi:hypothetical protein
MAKSGPYRWQGWVGGGSRTNPDARQRNCEGCRRPFVPAGDWVTHCVRCAPAANKKKARKKAKAKAAAKPGGTTTVKGGKVKKPKAPEATIPGARRLAGMKWPPSPTSTLMTAAVTVEHGVLVVTWDPQPAGEATVQVYDANGDRLVYRRVAASKGTCRVKDLASARQPVAVRIATPPTGPRKGRHASTSATVPT